MERSFKPHKVKLRLKQSHGWSFQIKQRKKVLGILIEFGVGSIEYNSSGKGYAIWYNCRRLWHHNTD